MTFACQNFKVKVNCFYKWFFVLNMPRRKATLSSEENLPKKTKVDSKTKTKVDSKTKTEVDSKKKTINNPVSTDTSTSDLVANLITKDGRASNLKIVSWNVAGVRAWAKKNAHDWLKTIDADIICLQETKCEEKDIPEPVKDMKEYYLYWNSAKFTKGYSGIALLSKIKPLDVSFGINIEEHDKEGRTITAEYDRFFLVTTYVPNSQRGLKRLEYRKKWNNDFKDYIMSLDAKKPVILCGDMNVSHLEIDLANPKQNQKNAGFTQEERDGMTELLQSGFVDTYRYMYPEITKKYTFWTYMGNARAKNVGWRLDYFIISKRWVKNLCDNVIESSVLGSDHCPIVLYFAL